MDERGCISPTMLMIISVIVCDQTDQSDPGPAPRCLQGFFMLRELFFAIAWLWVHLFFWL